MPCPVDCRAFELGLAPLVVNRSLKYRGSSSPARQRGDLVADREVYGPRWQHRFCAGWGESPRDPRAEPSCSRSPARQSGEFPRRCGCLFPGARQKVVPKSDKKCQIVPNRATPSPLAHRPFVVRASARRWGEGSGGPFRNLTVKKHLFLVKKRSSFCTSINHLRRIHVIQ
jgi:hypothetical protein